MFGPKHLFYRNRDPGFDKMFGKFQCFPAQYIFFRRDHRKRWQLHQVVRGRQQGDA